MKRRTNQPAAILMRFLFLLALMGAGVAPASVSAQTAPTCPCSIFASTAAPATAAANDTNAVELGVKFQADTTGYITGVRFYKGATNTGTHVGNLWSSTGTLLASATFSGETASGWQQVSFVNAVAVTANTTYVASYFAPHGNYAVTGAAFATSGVDNAPLHALSNGASGGNGLFQYGAASSFPTNSYNASNYFVDVVFNTTAPPPTPPSISGVASSGVSSSSATITWTTNVVTDSQVDYGPTTAYGSSSPLNSAMTNSHSVTLSNLSASTTYHYRARSKDSNATLATSADFTFTTTAPPTCPCTVWSTTATPGTASAADTNPYELGMKFQSDVAGYISGVRFYKGAANTGQHVGNLWSSSGALLASATFTNETATGWQQVSFGTAVQIAANTTYVASYRVPSGGYSVDANYFGSAGIDNAPLHALSNPAAGGNGVYSIGATSAFPNQSYNSSNYWVDVVFTTTPPPPPAPTTISNISSGTPGATSATITWTTSNAATSQVMYGTTTAYGSSTTLDGNMDTGHSQTLPSLTPSTLYHFQVQSKDGTGALVTSADNTFTTAAPPTCPCTIFSSTSAPAAPSAGDANAVELGVKIKSDLNGYITGIRFYKATSNAGTHIGNLWSSTGTRLAGATFTNETASGWQQVNFLSPVAITAGTTYVASYFAPQGNYAATGGTFSTNGIDSGTLHAPASASVGGNGVFQYSSSTTYPSQTYNGANYWVDVVFTSVAPPPATVAPVISALTASSANGNSGKVTWNTDVAADSLVDYGTTTAYGSSTTLDSSLVFNHSVTISGLTAGTTYHYRVKTKDNGGVLTTSADGTFTTLNPVVTGQWGPLMNWPLVAVHSTLLNNGKVLTWDAWEVGGTPSATIWDPATNAFTPVPESLAQIFCSAHVTLADGRILVIGGHNGTETGITATTIFDPASNTWSKGSSMAFPRWYPGATLLGDGRAVTLSGQITDGVWTPTPEVYDPLSDKWSTVAVDTSDVFEGQYPFMYPLANGKILNIMGETGRTRLLDVDAQTWVQAAPDEAITKNGSAIEYRPGKFLLTGGDHTGQQTEPVAAVLDMNQATPAWQQVAPMAFGREFHTMLNLPDGNVLVVGGSTTHDITTTVPGPLNAELWNPNTQTFTTLAPEQNPRMYHSTALLLPDATVLVAGGGKLSTAINYTTAEIYSPPYLFKGARPTITSAPASSTYGASITVQTPDAASIGSVALIHNGSDSHTNDFAARFLPLTFTAAAGSLTVQMPTVASTAPPGTYMLFIVNTNGVPSVSKFVNLQPTAPTTAATISNIASNSVSGVSATINWSTDRLADSSVDFGTTTAYGSTTADTVHKINHATQLINLTPSTTYHYRVKSKDNYGTLTTSGDFTFTTGAAPACPCSIFSPSSVPAQTNAYDDSPIETGVKFRAEADGYINGVRFYKGTLNTGTHTGNLWTTGGSLLATATFTTETASGWQQVTFSTPVHVTAGTTYVASVWAASGRYSATAEMLAAVGVDNPPVQALSNGDGVGNGLYLYTLQSAFPTNSFNGGNYWIDVVYTSNGVIADSLSTPSAGGGAPTASTAFSNAGTASLGGAAMTTDVTLADLSVASTSFDSTPVGGTVSWQTANRLPLEETPATVGAARKAVDLGIIQLQYGRHDELCPIGTPPPSTMAQIIAQAQASATARPPVSSAVSGSDAVPSALLSAGASADGLAVSLFSVPLSKTTLLGGAPSVSWEAVDPRTAWAALEPRWLVAPTPNLLSRRS